MVANRVLRCESSFRHLANGDETGGSSIRVSTAIIVSQGGREHHVRLDLNRGADVFRVVAATRGGSPVRSRILAKVVFKARVPSANPQQPTSPSKESVVDANPSFAPTPTLVEVMEHHEA
jgi:hypothetical protein